MVLDAVFGEPDWLWSRLPHPAVLMGRAITAMDLRFNRGRHRRRNGALCILGLCLAAAFLGLVIRQLPLGAVWEAVFAAVLFAQRSLSDHVMAVARALRSSVEEGRKTVAMIVGRDTAEMDAPAIARAAIESAAENFSDGVLAPMFWFVMGGLPALLVYKIVNTADSMIGYRTPRHEEFGWAAARFDDLLNLIPARATALMISAVYRQLTAWRDIVGDAHKHRSPNAGWPEAAMARALGVAVSGPRSYNGEMRDFPFVNPLGRRMAGHQDVVAAVRVIWVLWSVVLITAVLFAALSAGVSPN